jgi:hypothetical protein
MHVVCVVHMVWQPSYYMIIFSISSWGKSVDRDKVLNPLMSVPANLMILPARLCTIYTPSIYYVLFWEIREKRFVGPGWTPSCNKTKLNAVTGTSKKLASFLMITALRIHSFSYTWNLFFDGRLSVEISVI